MLKRNQRVTILEMHRKGCKIRRIARELRISRSAVKRVVESKSEDPPRLERSQKAEPYRQEILELYRRCQGNLARVHEELVAQGATLSYPALTAFCRREGIGVKPKVPSGRYHFEPGEEIQHDTSPHRIEIGGKVRLVQTASAVLCYSRMQFVQFYPRFRRFECKTFLTEALRYFGGAPSRLMIDNTHVIVLRGTGKRMVPVPGMKAFSDHFGFEIEAHELGDANRSARVERGFWHVERNFLAGRTFRDLGDLNGQGVEWCETKNGSFKRHLKARPVELFALEKSCLKPLPLWIPDPYLIHHRIVDTEANVSLATNRYSVPADWIGHRVQIRETYKTLEIQADNRPAVRHERVLEPSGKRSILPEHRVKRGLAKHQRSLREEEALKKAAPELEAYIRLLKRHGRKRITLALRQLLRMVREYPREALVSAIREASHYGLYDLDRVERMILRRIADDYFLLPSTDHNDPDRGENS